jgi:Zn-dependent peptidase ImmA (M78 family)
MAFDLQVFADRLNSYCEQYIIDESQLANDTGIPSERFTLLKTGQSVPTGDEILIIADFFKCYDFNIFISNDIVPLFEKTEELYRQNSDINLTDRWNILEFLFLCECEHFLLRQMPDLYPVKPFPIKITEPFNDKQVIQSANQLRELFKIEKNAINTDIFADFREIGIHIFRRKLALSTISSLYIHHPVVGHCILVNYDEDIYSQRFSVVYEVAHAIFNRNAFNISNQNCILITKENNKRTSNELLEVLANKFAVEYLISAPSLQTIPYKKSWNDDKIIKYSKKFLINPITLSIALKNENLITNEDFNKYSKLIIPKNEKENPEIKKSLSKKNQEKKLYLLQKGLSDYYVSICFQAYRNKIISKGRLAEMLLCISPNELLLFSEIYGKNSSNYININNDPACNRDGDIQEKVTVHKARVI